MKTKLNCLFTVLAWFASANYLHASDVFTTQVSFTGTNGPNYYGSIEWAGEHTGGMVQGNDGNFYSHVGQWSDVVSIPVAG